MASKGLAYERLDQLTIEVLLGVASFGIRLLPDRCSRVPPIPSDTPRYRQPRCN